MRISKTTSILYLLALHAFQPLLAQEDEIRRYDANAKTEVEFEIKQTRTPVFPSRLKVEGYTEGHATFSVYVNQFGELEDYLLLEATHLEFAESVELVLPDWDYSVPMVDGESTAFVSTVQINFERNGVIVYEAIGMHFINHLTRNLNSDTLEYRIHSANELDRIPEPTHIVRPDFHIELLEERTLIEAEYEFFIDSEGAVRMPILVRADNRIDERLLVIAQESLLQWKFNAPTIGGRPVVTKTKQLFRFSRRNLTYWEE